MAVQQRGVFAFQTGESNEFFIETAHRIRGGLTLTCLGDAAPLTYKRSYTGQTTIDRAATSVLSRQDAPHHEIDFFPYGYDERQYNSPGFRLPVGSLMRSRHGTFPEYHTSADNLEFISGAQLAEAVDVVHEILTTVDGLRRYRSLADEGEPQLGRRGLYRALGGGGDPQTQQFAMLWLLQMGDGTQTLLDVASRSGIDFDVVEQAALMLEEHDLLGWC